MADANAPPNPLRSFLILGTLVLVVAALYWAQKVLIPVALAILLTFILSPLVLFLQRRGLNRVLAVVVVTLLAFSLLAGLVYGLLVEVRDLSQEMAQHSKHISQKIANLQGSEPGVVSNFLKVFREIGREIEKAVGSLQRASEEQLGQQRVQKVEVINRPTGGLEWFPVVARPLVEVLASIGLVIMLVVFMLVRREDLRNRLLRLIGHGRVTVTTRALDEAAQRISRLLLTQLAINVCFGLALACGLFLIGVPYAYLWGFLAALLRFVPYVGTWIAALMPLTISVAVADDWFQPLMVLGLFAALELLTANVLEPLLFSHSTGISSVALLVSAAFWTWLWGPVGLVLSAPLSVCLAVLGRYVPALEFFDVLLGDEPALSPRVGFYQRLLAHDQDEATELVEDYLTTHSYETVFDDLLVPALVYAKHDRENNGLAPEDEHFVLQTMRSLLEDVVQPQQEVSLIATQGPEAVAEDQGPARPAALLLGCPARDEEDELALHLFGRLLRSRHYRLEVLFPRMLAAEVVSRVEQERPALVCIAALPPGGLAQARYLCKRLRAGFPDLPVVVGRWGQMENLEGMKQRLLSAGANGVGTSLQESRAQAAPVPGGERDGPGPAQEAGGPIRLAGSRRRPRGATRSPPAPR